MISNYREVIPDFRNIRIAEEISVTLPAHVWMAFWVAYGQAQWQEQATTIVALAAQEAILDPEYVQKKKDEIEKHSEEIKRQKEEIDNHLSGLFPKMPSRNEAEDYHGNHQEQGYL